MILSSYPIPYTEAVCSYEALRRLGFEPEDIYFMVSGRVDDEELCQWGHQVIVVLRSQEKEFLIVVGHVDEKPDQIEQKWIEIATAMGKGEVEDLSEVYKNSFTVKAAPQLITALVTKGFYLPVTQN